LRDAHGIVAADFIRQACQKRIMGLALGKRCHGSASKEKAFAQRKGTGRKHGNLLH